MNTDLANTFCIVNNELTPTESHTFKASGKIIYEVFRIIAGIPLFYEDHMERLHQSCNLAGFGQDMLPQIKLAQLSTKLCNACSVFFGIAELKIYKENGNTNFSLGFINRPIPKPTDYIEGVVTDFLEAEREAPHEKVKNTPLRSFAKSILDKNPLIRELIYVNSLGQLTEGNRSNLFLIKGNLVYTAPANLVLKGITRKYVKQAISESGLELREEAVLKKDLHTFDAAWISGTSRGILPIKTMGDYAFDPQNEHLKTLLIAFNTILQNYLSEA